MNKMIITILALTVHLSSFGQEIIRQDGYYQINQGVYETKSLDKELISLESISVEPQTKFLREEGVAFIKVNGTGVALFDNINDSGTEKSSYVLTKTSVVKVDTIFYNEIFKDPAKEWALTFNVWYAITINGRSYYTDYKIHDFLAFELEYPKYNQEFLLVSQSTGYDDFYDIGYPNYFFIVILDEKNEMIFESEILDFDYGDEFWDEISMSSATKLTERGLEFSIIGLEEEYKGIWNGKKLENRNHDR